jgi:hypothetical protein
MLVTIKLHGVTQQNVINFIPSSIENGQLICGLLSKKVGDGHTDIKLMNGIFVNFKFVKPKMSHLH